MLWSKQTYEKGGDEAFAILRILYGRTLGALESKVIEILWNLGSANVQDVLRELDQPRAYTTIMTTLDRLFKKGLLDRQKERNWFRYTPKFSRAEWGQEQARDWFAGFLAGSSGPDVLLSSLVDAVGEQDVSLLDELQCKVALRKKQVQDGPTSGDT